MDDEEFLSKFVTPTDVAAEQKKIQEVERFVKEKNAIILKDSCTRNLIFVGKTRSGKSTAMNVLKDPTYQAKTISIYSETKEPNLYPFTVECTDNKIGELQNYNINLIDTPGLFEVYQKKEDIRNNENIRKAIVTCLKHEITKIHGIFFVCSFTTGVNSEEILAFKEFIDLFKGAEDKIHMLISRAESLSLNDKKKLEEEISSHPEMKELLNLVGKRILFTGAVLASHFEKGNSKGYIDEVKNITGMRKELFGLIFSLKEYAQLGVLEYYREQQLKAEEYMEKCLILKDELLKKELSEAKLKEKEDELKKLKINLEEYKSFICTEHGMRKYEQVVHDRADAEKVVGYKCIYIQPV